MKKIHWSCETGFAGAVWEDTFEVPDDCTDDEIDEMVYDEVMNYISWNWDEVEDDEDN